MVTESEDAIKNKKELLANALKERILKEKERIKQEKELYMKEFQKRRELEEQKKKDTEELESVKEQLAESIVKSSELQDEKIRVFEHLKRLINDVNKPHFLDRGDAARLCNIGLAVPYVTTQPTTASSRTSSLLGQLKNTKRFRSPSPPMLAPPTLMKHPARIYQKMEDIPRRDIEFVPHVLWPNSKPGSMASYSNFYPGLPTPLQNRGYPYPAGRDRHNSESLGQSQPPPLNPLQPQHVSSYGSPIQNIPSTQPSSRINHGKPQHVYQEEKIYSSRAPGHSQVHSVTHTIPQTAQSMKVNAMPAFPVRHMVPTAQSQGQKQIPLHHPQVQIQQTLHHQPTSHFQLLPHHQQPPHHSQSSHHPSPHHSQGMLQPVHHIQPQSHHLQQSNQQSHHNQTIHQQQQQPPHLIQHTLQQPQHHNQPGHHQTTVLQQTTHGQQSHQLQHSQPPMVHHQQLHLSQQQQQQQPLSQQELHQHQIMHHQREMSRHSQMQQQQQQQQHKQPSVLQLHQSPQTMHQQLAAERDNQYASQMGTSMQAGSNRVVVYTQPNH